MFLSSSTQEYHLALVSIYNSIRECHLALVSIIVFGSTTWPLSISTQEYYLLQMRRLTRIPLPGP